MNTQNHLSISTWKAAQPKDIVLLHADVNYTNILFANGRKMIVATTMKKIEERLERSNMFFRTHKSYMVNLKYIKHIDYLHTEDFIEMQNDYRVLISRRRKLAFNNRVKEFNA